LLLPAFSASAALSFISLRSYRWKLSPSMMAAFTFSRRKMFSKVRVTEVVPAPDEPVIAMMGWRSDMVGPSDKWFLNEFVLYPAWNGRN
jgi:hypothetical protein